MTTDINTLLNSVSIDEDDDDDEDEDLTEIIMDMSRPVDIRLKALEEYHNNENVGDNAIEIISTMAGMYQMSGSKRIENFFYCICTNSKLSSFMKMEAAKSLLEYEEMEEESDTEEYEEERIAREERNIKVRQNNTEHRVMGFKALNYVCNNLKTIPTPYRIEIICKMMESEEFQTNTENYFKEFVCDDNIDCDFRYKSILSLENKSVDIMKKEITKLFNDKEFLTYFYNSLETVIGNLFPNIKVDINSRRLWDEVLYRLKYDDIRHIYKEKFPNKPSRHDLFICKAQLAFLFHKPAQTYYRILSGQYLLQKCEINDSERSQVENQLLDFAKDKELDYNRRADSADILLSLGSPSMKQYGHNIIMELGKSDRKNHTIFDNAQNVHNEKVEESVTEALEFLSTLPLYQVKGTAIDFNYVNYHIEEMLKEERKCLSEKQKNSEQEYLAELKHNIEICEHCENNIKEKIQSDEGKKFCSKCCLNFFYRDEKIRLAMNRIFMDRVLYSKFNSSLVNILLKIFTYIILQGEEDKILQQQMYKRLLEELEEMSGTCSSGFATRLINVISGFGQFNIRISYEEQIIANFTGRLNAAARRITEPSSIFREKMINDVVELWLKHADNKELYNEIESKINPSGKIEKKPSIKDIVNEFIKENRISKIDQCVEDFAEAVLNEMTISSSNYAQRQNFSLFFRTYVSIIREELSSEFKELISDTDFDLAFRRALITYEGEI